MRPTRIILVALLALVVGGIFYFRSSDSPDAAGQSTASGRSATAAAGGKGGAGVSVITAAAGTADIPQTRDAVGWIEPIATVAVKARIDGVIVEQAARDGVMVKAGDVLFRLDDSTIRATIAKDQAALAKDQANLDQAKSELARQKKLLDRKVATQQAYDLQMAAMKVQDATVAMDQAQLQADQVQLGYATITAPISGRTGAVNVTPGNLVHPTDATALVTITEMAPLRVTFNVPERDLDRYRAALAGTAAVPVTVSHSETGKQLATGRLTFIDSAVDTAAGAVTLKAEFANDDGALWPGQYVHVRTQLGLDKGATVVPLVAVQQNNDGPFVFLVKSDHKVAITPVTMGVVHGDQVVIASGLKPGDRVVVDGQLRLADGMTVREGGANGGGDGAPKPAPSG
jgi:multidrug efflux system membrane fusion protein